MTTATDDNYTDGILKKRDNKKLIQKINDYPKKADGNKNKTKMNTENKRKLYIGEWCIGLLKNL